MNCYEHTFIAKQYLPESQNKKLVEKYQNIITHFQVQPGPDSGASILNQRVKKRTGFGLVLNQTKSHLVFSHQNQTKSKPLYFFNIKTKPKPNKLIFFFFQN